MIKYAPPAYEKLDGYYKTYWKYFQDKDMLISLKDQSTETMSWLESIPFQKESFAYDHGKWMLKEVVGHVCDAERVISYRALCFSRNEKQPLPSFDENDYMRNSNFKDRPLKDILKEWKSVRAASLSLFSSMTEEMLDREGIANNVKVSARIILYFIVVHERHHMKVIRERYLDAVIDN